MRNHLRECLEKGLFKSFPKILLKVGRQFDKDAFFEVNVFCICRQPALEESVYLPKRLYITWIQCSKAECCRWYHNQCVDILDKDLAKWSKKKYICPLCDKGKNLLPGLFIILYIH